jgi:hypothetical protein
MPKVARQRTSQLAVARCFFAMDPNFRIDGAIGAELPQPYGRGETGISRSGPLRLLYRVDE